jgi:hypothetical protein
MDDAESEKEARMIGTIHVSQPPSTTSHIFIEKVMSGVI